MEISSINFKAPEFRCKCGVCKEEAPHRMKAKAVQMLQELREEYGKPMALTSAYRCAKHPVEAGKIRKGKKPGQHNAGTAVDIAVTSGRDAFEIQRLAYKLGFTGIALGKGFVHLDVRNGKGTTWKY